MKIINSFFKKAMEEKILKQLSTIKLEGQTASEGKNNNHLNLEAVSKIIIKDNSISFALDLDLLGLTLEQAKDLELKCQKKLKEILPEKQLKIILTSTTQPKPTTETATKIIAIASGKGGVGKSTLSVNLALAFKRIGFKVGLVDADIYGPSLTHMMNLQDKPQTLGNLMLPISSYGIECISLGSLIEPDQAILWRAPMLVKTLYQLIKGVKWPELDYLIIDLPPGTGDIPISLIQQFSTAGAVIVSTPQEIALIDVTRSIDMFKKLQVPILGIVQNMAYLLDKESGQKNYLFGKDGAKNLAHRLEINFLGDIILDSKIRESGDHKNPIVNADPSSDIAFLYGRIAENILDQLKTLPHK